MSQGPFVLLVNPWIVDFAAHDLWAKPIGLLWLGALLREGGFRVSWLDCLDRSDPETAGRPDILPGQDQSFGCGKYPKTPIPTPEPIRALPRRFFRYGIHPESLRSRLHSIPQPDLIWITSVMTYWYPGVQATIAEIRQAFPSVPMWLGGIYARLCPDHARRTSGADRVVDLPLGALPDELERATGHAVCNEHDWGPLARAPQLALDLVPHPTYVPLLTSLGCGRHCPYCASHQLQPGRERRNAESLLQEIRYWRSRGLVDFAFHDDALLQDADETLRPALERLVEENIRVRFHTPNGLLLEALTPNWCRLLFRAGFETIRLGLETTHPAQVQRLGTKASLEMFCQTMENLRSAGFTSRQIGVYLLAGLPGQCVEEVAESIRSVAEAGAQPRLCEYSPIPGTSMWEEAVRLSSFDLAGEPLTHNNSFFACRRKDFTVQHLAELKALARASRRALP